MHPVEKGELQPVKMLGHGLIGRQHEIFNDIGGHIALIGEYVQRSTLPVQNDLALREIKVDAASLPPLFPQQ